MPGPLDAILGAIFNRGVPIEIGGGLDFINGGASFNSSTGRIDISQPNTIGGVATVTASNTSVAVVFDTAFTAADYQVLITPDTPVLAPAAGSNRVTKITDKTAAGFTFHVEVAPGGITSYQFNWFVFQGTDAP